MKGSKTRPSQKQSGQKRARAIDGKAIAETIKQGLKETIATLRTKPGLAIILVGDDKASHLYVKLKKKASEWCDISFHQYIFAHDSDEKEILDTILFLNNDPEIHGIIVQLPLPKNFHEDTIIKAIDPKKDVDGFHPDNTKKLRAGVPDIVPGLALSILRLITETGETLSGKHALIISNHPIFAEPLTYLFQKEKMSSEYRAPDDPELKKKCKHADIIVIAIGRPNFLTKNMIKKDAIIIDVGITPLDNGTIVGDVAPNVWEKAAWVTPVPGGVGPMTVAMLLYNTYLLAVKK